MARRAAICSLLAVALLSCGGGSQPTANTSTTTTTPTPKRLACTGIKSFIATGAPIGQSLRYDSSSDAAIARAVSEGAGAKSSVKVGDEATLDAAAYAELKSQLPDVSAGVRYAVLDAGGHVTEEVVVAEFPEGWRAARYDSCK